jgi:hypothetical protein
MYLCNRKEEWLLWVGYKFEILLPRMFFCISRCIGTIDMSVCRPIYRSTLTIDMLVRILALTNMGPYIYTNVSPQQHLAVFRHLMCVCAY